jgi:catechol 2,3-dioxygenase-like lactoylglutathione lyase family enzyme
MTAALVLTGAPGTGKTSVLEALGTLLEIDDVAYGAIESEQLAWGWPWLEPSQWLPQLASVIALQRQAGRRLFLVAATTETADELGALVGAIGAQRVLTVCLSAPPEVAAKRVAAREPDRWPGKAALVAHARELAASMPSIDGIDLVLETDGRDPEAVADEVRDALRARGMLDGTAHLEHVAVIVEDYEEAIEFFVGALGFELVEDAPALTTDGRPKRWVVVRPPGARTGVLLARADGDEQAAAVGRQFAGRVGLFLRVDDFDAAYERMRAAGVRFVGEPRREPYGRVVVFVDVAGNRWDLLGQA